MFETNYQQNTDGNCPHCQKAVHFDQADQVQIGQEMSSGFYPTHLRTKSGNDEVEISSSKCPSCQKPIVIARIHADNEDKIRLVHPFNVVRTVPKELPKEIRKGFLEAAAVLPMSEKASAALSRQCLQTLLSDVTGKRRNLSDLIDQVLPALPSRIAENLDATRKIGNFANHPEKSLTTGMIVDVEPEEANWNLEVLEDLFEYYYVQPARAREKRARLDKKLSATKKQPTK